MDDKKNIKPIKYLDNQSTVECFFVIKVMHFSDSRKQKTWHRLVSRATVV